MITNYNLFLDDIRVPTNVTWVDIPKDQHYSLVRNYQEFVDLITLRGLPKFVCYDHDLSDIHYGHGLINRNDLNGDDIRITPTFPNFVVLDSNKNLFHELEKVKKGIKYNIVSFYSYDN